jgi:hypothetical protein
MTEQDLQSVLEEQIITNMKFGTILVNRKIVQTELIQEILIGQITETVIQIFGWKEGSYEFTPQAVPVDKDFPISIDTQHLLMEGLRIVDDWSLIEGKITLDTVFTKDTEYIQELTEEEEEILSLVDGENDVSTIIDITGKDDFLISRTLVSLMEKGVILPKETAPVVSKPPAGAMERAALVTHGLLILAIIISLVLALYPLFLSSLDSVKRFQAAQTIGDLRYKIESYHFEHGIYPEKIDILSRRIDPWGNPYIYISNKNTYMVSSAGVDRTVNTADDIY